jgi:LytR cell envelope-related transcriptional attenuator
MNARRPPAKSPGATTSLRVILVVGVAAVLGWFILRNGFPGTGGSDGGDASSATTTVVTTTSVAPTTTTVNMAGTKIVVANGSGVGGSAGRMSDVLREEGYAVIEPTNAVRNDYAVTEIYFTQGFEAQAGVVARELGVAVTGLLPDPSPVPADGIQDANVIIVLGKDLASQPSLGTTVAPSSTG